MQCRERGCNDIRGIDLEFPILMRIKFRPYQVYPCCGCGRLHFRDGEPVVKRGKRVFFDVEKREVVYKK